MLHAARVEAGDGKDLEPTPSEGRQRWHYDTLSSPQPPPPALVLVMAAGRRELLEHGHHRRIRRGRRTFRGPGDYWPDGAAGGLSRSTPRQADDATTRPSGAGRRVSPTTGTQSQTTCYVQRGTGRVCLRFRKKSFLPDSQHIVVSG